MYKHPSIGWEPAELLNAKHDARRFNAFPMSRYSKYPRNWSFLGWCSKKQQHKVEHVKQIDVEFNCLSNDNTNIFGGWEPAALFSVKGDATEKWGQKRRVLNSPKNGTNRQASIYYQTGCWIQLPIYRHEHRSHRLRTSWAIHVKHDAPEKSVQKDVF